MASYTFSVCGPEDRDGFLELVEEVFGADFAISRRQTWDWVMTANPANRVRQSEALLLKRDEQIIGGLILFAGLLKAGDKIVPVQWIGSIMTHPKHRGQGLRIMKGLALSSTPLMGFPRDSTVQMYVRYGGTVVGRSGQSFCLIDAGRWMASKAPVLSGLAPLFRSVWSLSVATARALLSPSPAMRYVVRRIQRFDAEFDSFWEEVSPGYENICVRDKDLLNWRYADCPHRSYTLYAVYDDGHLAGYAVTKLADGPDFPTGFLVDFLVRAGDGTALSLLLKSATDDLKKAGAVIIKFFRMAEPAWFDGVFFRQGFFFKKAHFNMLGYFPDDDLARYVSGAKGWFMTLGDSDNEI